MDYGQINPPPYLLGRIMNAIADERLRLKAIRRFAVASVFLATTLAASYFAWTHFAAAFVASGFGQYLAIAFVDLRSVLANWHDFAMSLLESFPALHASGLLAAFAAILLSSRFVFANAKKILSFRGARMIGHRI